MTEIPTRTLDADQLRTLFLFEALTDEQLQYLSENGEVRTFDAGATVFREGDPADCLYVLVDGGLRMSRLVGTEDLVVNETSMRGVYSGAIRAFMDDPNDTYINSITTTVASSFWRLPASDFSYFMHHWFPMAVHLLEGIYIGVRNTEAQVRQREHLANLGTLSANLAHELNNPAAATVRATAQLRERFATIRHKLAFLAAGDFDTAVMGKLVALQDAAVERAALARTELTPVQESDLEDEIGAHLDELNVHSAYELASVLAAAGMDVDWIDQVNDVVGPEGLSSALRWLGDTLDAEALMDELENASNRISTMVAAVKQYSHMDEASYAELDLHPGLDATVVMLGFKLAGVDVVREYDHDLPKLPVYGAELNQVWTNLIDNAADAMKGSGTLTLRTRRQGDYAVVEIADNGPGIPEDVRDRIFEPFFTTKPPGEGSGLGLETARRIVVKRHHGKLEVETSDAGTTFSVYLPLVRS
jgi:signal transduction histidine kinase